MGVFMRKELRFLVPVVIACCCLMYCKGSSPNGPTTTHSWCDQVVDGYTSASVYKSLQLDSINIYDTYAVIYWYERYDNEGVDAYRIEFGADPTSYSDTLKFNPITAKTHWSDTLRPLAPNATYYLQFYRSYHRKANIDTLSPFTTCPSESVP